MDCDEDSARRTPDASATTLSGWQRAAPAVTLLLLAPVISEVLFGATRISVLFVLIPEIAVWGCGALIIRHAVRRRHRGWVSLLLLGVALAIAEECIIQQTSLAPLVGLASNAYGRVWGVNWPYLLWALGYESIWVVVLPVQLTELIFPARRNQLWVGKRGIIVASGFFVLGSVIAWYSWTQHARTEVFHMPEYQPPLGYVLLAIVAIVLAVASAFSRWTSPQPERPENSRSTPRPWLVGLTAFGFGLPWCLLNLLALGVVPMIPFDVPTIAGIAWACTAFLLMKHWTSSHAWNDMHRLAVVFGGVGSCMIAGFVMFVVGGALPMDWIGKVVLNVIAVLLLTSLGRKLRHQPEAVGGRSEIFERR